MLAYRKLCSFSTLSLFPSLTITQRSLIPNNLFSKRQAEFLNSDNQYTQSLSSLLLKKKIGLVAHFYMDAEIQGVISKLPPTQRLISDSLLMGQGAVDQAKNGAKHVIVLGVDFMSENVRAPLDKNGFQDVSVYRLANRKIGCSLAESAEKLAYKAFLMKGMQTNPESLHVIYINTSLQIKGRSNQIMPTITCTSSNVVRTILQAFAQNKNLDIWFGPDTYMGENLFKLFTKMSMLSDNEIQKIHPEYTQGKIKNLLSKFHYFNDGICIVHHFFDNKLVSHIRKNFYEDSFITAHLEVPGDMFTLAYEKQLKNQGVVGSTSDILKFILKKTEDFSTKTQKRIKIILGTESGMISMIVSEVQNILKRLNSVLEVEIIFPVSDEAISQNSKGDLMPGLSHNEGCSIHGGCATCPFMKMNSLESLMDVCEMIGDKQKDEKLGKYIIKNRAESEEDKKVLEEGVAPIMEMQYFQKNGKLSETFIETIQKNAKNHNKKV